MIPGIRGIFLHFVLDQIESLDSHSYCIMDAQEKKKQDFDSPI